MTKYVITDPCYIIDEEAWSKICLTCRHLTGEDYQTVFDTLIRAELKAITGNPIAVVAETGFGDWTNDITEVCSGTTILNKRFCADAGMVSFCELTPAVEEALGKYCGSHFAAVFETDLDICCDVDRSNTDWTVLTINEKGTGRTLLETDDGIEEEEDDDDYGYDEDVEDY